jgi:hypothetical protein
MQNISKKTYMEMGDEDKLLIEAYCYEFGLSSKQAADYIDWPWQSISAHLKIMDDRLERKKDSLDHLRERARETIARLGLVKPEIKAKPVKEVDIDSNASEKRTDIPVACKPVTFPPSPFYVLAIEEYMRKLYSGKIAFISLLVDDERGVLELKYKKEPK